MCCPSIRKGRSQHLVRESQSKDDRCPQSKINIENMKTGLVLYWTGNHCGVIYGEGKHKKERELCQYFRTGGNQPRRPTVSPGAQLARVWCGSLRSEKSRRHAGASRTSDEYPSSTRLDTKSLEFCFSCSFVIPQSPFRGQSLSCVANFLL